MRTVKGEICCTSHNTHEIALTSVRSVILLSRWWCCCGWPWAAGGGTTAAISQKGFSPATRPNTLKKKINRKKYFTIFFTRSNLKFLNSNERTKSLRANVVVFKGFCWHGRVAEKEADKNDTTTTTTTTTLLCMCIQIFVTMKHSNKPKLCTEDL